MSEVSSGPKYIITVAEDDAMPLKCHECCVLLLEKDPKNPGYLLNKDELYKLYREAETMRYEYSCNQVVIRVV